MIRLLLHSRKESRSKDRWTITPLDFWHQAEIDSPTTSPVPSTDPWPHLWNSTNCSMAFFRLLPRLKMRFEGRKKRESYRPCFSWDIVDEWLGREMEDSDRCIQFRGETFLGSLMMGKNWKLLDWQIWEYEECFSSFSSIINWQWENNRSSWNFEALN